MSFANITRWADYSAPLHHIPVSLTQMAFCHGVSMHYKVTWCNDHGQVWTGRAPAFSLLPEKGMAGHRQGMVFGVK